MLRRAKTRFAAYQDCTILHRKKHHLTITDHKIYHMKKICHGILVQRCFNPPESGSTDFKRQPRHIGVFFTTMHLVIQVQGQRQGWKHHRQSLITEVSTCLTRPAVRQGCGVLHFSLFIHKNNVYK